MIKKEKGAITLYVLLTCLFFTFILSMVYVSNLNKIQVQEQEVKQIQENYKRQISRAEEIYETYKEQASEIITISFIPNGNEEWEKTNSTQVIVNTSQENESKIKQIKYIWSKNEKGTDFTNAQTIQNKETVTKSSETGEYYLHVQVESLDGKIVTAHSKVFKFDNTAPNVTFGTNGSTTWRKSQSTTVTVTDGESGVKESSLKYMWTQSTTEPAANSFTSTFTNKGTITKNTGSGNNWYLWILAEDNVGNQTITRSNTFYLDNTTPTVTFSINENTTWRKSQSTTVTVTDGESGVKEGSLKYIWTQNTTAPEANSFTSTFTNGDTITKNTGSGNNWYLWILAEDNVGNQTITRSNEFYLDNTAPTVAFSPNGSTTWKKSQSTKVTVTEAHSGIKTLKYAWSTSTATPTFNSTFSNNETITKSDGTGKYYLHVQIEDNVGNVTTARSNAFYIDNTAPVITAGTSTATSATSFRLNITANDNESGLNKYFVTTSTTAPTIDTSGWENSTSGNYIYSGAATNTTYYVYVQDGAGNISNAQKIVTTPLNYSIDDSSWTETLEQAVNVAKTSGSTIKLLNDYTDKSTVSISKSLIYDTNGHTLTRSEAINIGSEGKVVVTGKGKIQSNEAINILQNTGTLEFDTNFTGTIEMNNNNIPSQGMMSCVVNNAEGTLNIKNGIFTSIGNRNIVNYGKGIITGGKLTLNDKTSNLNGSCIFNKGNLDMTSATVNSNVHGVAISGQTAISNITKCTINNNSTSLPSLFAQGDGGKMYVYETTIVTSGTQRVASISEGGGEIYLFDCNDSGYYEERGTGLLVEVVKNNLGYTVYYYTSDKDETVEFPTWTYANGQDDIIWHKATYGTRNNWGCYSQTIEKSEHKNETGTYITHIYINKTSMGGFNYDVK